MQSRGFKREDYRYQAAYCEENIWHLCQQEPFKNSFVVFIVSRGDSFPMLNQRASQHPLFPIFWDYHVVLLVMSEANKILDFDTQLPFYTDVERYFEQSFIAENLLLEHEMPMFRLVRSEEFVRLFASDRSHMKSPSGWLAPTPNWPLIGRSGSNLSSFIEASDNEVGELLTYNAILARFKSDRAGNV
jgi:hypothetical protein